MSEENLKSKVDIADGSHMVSSYVEPLDRGCLVSALGNGLRRILLSSLDGLSSIKIDGVLLEFSTIPGILKTLRISSWQQLCIKVEDINCDTFDFQKDGMTLLQLAEQFHSRSIES